jgi:tetratricopeptide (TPR) repeat protein
MHDRTDSRTMSTRNLLTYVAVLFATGCGSAAPPERAADFPKDQSGAWLFERGAAAARAGDTARAEQYLTLAMNRGFPRARAVPILLGACVAAQRMRAALDYAESELRRDPTDEDLRYLVATLRLALGQTESARTELDRLLRADPEHADAHYLLGVLDSERGDRLQSARFHFDRYLARTPDGSFRAEVESRLSDLGAESSEAP